MVAREAFCKEVQRNKVWGRRALVVLGVYCISLPPSWSSACDLHALHPRVRYRLPCSFICGRPLIFSPCPRARCPRSSISARYYLPSCRRRCDKKLKSPFRVSCVSPRLCCGPVAHLPAAPKFCRFPSAITPRTFLSYKEDKPTRHRRSSSADSKMNQVSAQQAVTPIRV